VSSFLLKENIIKLLCLYNTLSAVGCPEGSHKPFVDFLNCQSPLLSAQKISVIQAICQYQNNYTSIYRYILQRTLWWSGQHSSFVFGSSQFQISARRPVILSEVFRDFPQYLQSNAEYLKIKPQPLPSKS
jgi:hypothetical protein